MDDIRNAIKCQVCLKTFEKPIILPCGETICEKHIPAMTKVYECNLCEDRHEVPTKGFSSNKSMLKILGTNLERCEFGRDYAEAHKSWQELDALCADVDSFRRDPAYYIVAVCDDMRMRINLKREELKMHVDQEADRLMRAVDDYADKCSRTVAHDNELKSFMETVWLRFSMTQTAVDRSRVELKNLAFNDTKWKEIKKDSDKEAESLRWQLDTLKQKMTLNQLNFYENLPLKLDELFMRRQIRSFDSQIVDAKQTEDLMCLCEFDNKENEWHLVYRGSDDGFGAHDFHAKCDNISCTLVLIKSTHGCIFGGYTSQTWDGSGYKTDTDAFLFSLVNKYGKSKSLKISIASESAAAFAIYCQKSSGPQFGKKEIYVCDLANTCCDSSSHIGKYYNCAVVHYGSDEAKSLLGGVHKFQIKEIEVFRRQHSSCFSSSQQSNRSN